MKDKERAVYKAVGRMTLAGTPASDLTVSAIAREAGVGKGTVYEYFRTKEELISNALCYSVIVEAEQLLADMTQCAGMEARLHLVLDRIEQVSAAHRFLADAFWAVGQSVGPPAPGASMATVAVPLLEQILTSIADSAREENVLQKDAPDSQVLLALAQVIAGHAYISHMPDLAQKEQTEERIQRTIDMVCSVLSMFGE